MQVESTGKDRYRDMKTLMGNLRLGRIPYFCVFFLLSQACYLLFPAMAQLPNALLGAALVSGISVVCLILYFAFGKRIRASERGTILAVDSFWVLILAAMTPHTLTDITVFNFPIYALIAALALTMSPLIGGSGSVCSMLLLLGCHLILAFLLKASVSYCLLLIGLTTLMYLLSSLSQKQYLAVIHTLKLETLHDPLTGLLNRRGGYDKLNTVFELCRRHGERIAVYMADIDYFKEYNDTYGHALGDDALRRIAASMKDIFCRTSDVVCRCGGEEFFIAASVTSDENAAQMAERLRTEAERMAIPCKAPNGCGYLTISVGFTVFSPNAQGGKQNELQLLSQADQALYQAKNGGRNRVCAFMK